LAKISALKKLFSILFLLIFLFNVGGFYVLFWGLKSQANRELLSRLDAEQYASGDLVVITIPVSLPYPIQQNGYERVDGEFQYDGQFYNLVKQRLENDTLFLVCIKDHKEGKLVEVLNEYTNLANNLPTTAKHTLEQFGKLFKDYTASNWITEAASVGWCLQIAGQEPFVSLPDISYRILTPPPKV
jgi:hypothetical protein